MIDSETFILFLKRAVKHVVFITPCHVHALNACTGDNDDNTRLKRCFGNVTQYF